MKNAKKSIAGLLSLLIIAGGFTGINKGFSSSAASASGLPANVIVGYWHNFNNGSTTTRLADVNSEWDVLNVSFMETQGDRCTAKFAPDTEVYPSNGEAEMKADIKKLQEKGKKVVVSLGGQNGTIGLGSTAARDTFLSTSMEVIENYGFDGFDVDLEGSSITISGSDSLTTLSSPIQVNLNYILHYYKATYGDDFLITMAPEHPYVQGGAVGWGSPWGAYLPLLNNCRDILSWIHPQYYNNGIQYENCSGYNANSLIECSKMLINGFKVANGQFFEGLKPSQVAFGVPASGSAAGSGYQSISSYQEALRTLLQEYPDFRGVMTWSTNWDERQNNAFVNGMRATINQYGDLSFGFGSVSANKASADVGDTVTWTASVKNPEGAVSYKFDLYKDGKSVSQGSYSSSNTFSYKIADEGEYYVSVTAKDSAGTEVSGKSTAITATVGELALTDISCSVKGIVKAENPVTFTASAVGGIPELEYDFVVYNGSEVAFQSGYTAASSYTVTPISGGEYKAVVTVKDARGITKSGASSKFFVKQALKAEDIEVTKDGNTVMCKVKTSGGAGGNRYSFYIYANGKVYDKEVSGDSIVFTTALAPKFAYTVRAYVQDSEGNKVAISKTVS